MLRCRNLKVQYTKQEEMWPKTSKMAMITERKAYKLGQDTILQYILRMDRYNARLLLRLHYASKRNSFFGVSNGEGR
jgi:hypothetical protein